MDPKTGICTFLQSCPPPSPKQRINVVGGVLVFCDPKTWPKNPEELRLPEGWFVAVGVHPKHASQFGDYYHDRLSKLMDSPAGEIGLDCSEGQPSFAIQLSTFRWALALCWLYLSLVLYVRASGDNPHDTDKLYRLVLGVVQERVPNLLQGIHLHCFSGDSAMVKLWLEAYPGTYFGFSTLVKGFAERQRRGLQAVPGTRLLLESDSPHLPDVAGSVNHPNRLWRDAEEVAWLRD